MNSTRIRLLCLPYAGGSEAAYMPWRTGLPPWVELQPVPLPGRGSRIAEAPVADCRALTERLWTEWRLQMQAPYALFGHSMGALLAYELALRAQDNAGPPLALFVSGSAAPALRRPHPAWTGSDDDLLGLVRDLGGTPRELLDEPEWRDMLLPVLRADFRLCATHQPTPRAHLKCPVYVLAGDADPATACARSVAAWSAESAVGGEIRYFRGGHFYLREQQAAVLSFITSTLRQVLPRHSHGMAAA